MFYSLILYIKIIFTTYLNNILIPQFIIVHIQWVAATNNNHCHNHTTIGTNPYHYSNHISDTTTCTNPLPNLYPQQTHSHHWHKPTGTNTINPQPLPAQTHSHQRHKLTTTTTGRILPQIF